MIDRDFHLAPEIKFDHNLSKPLHKAPWGVAEGVNACKSELLPELWKFPSSGGAKKYCDFGIKMSKWSEKI